MNIRLLTYLFFGALGLSACGPDHLYEQSYPITSGNWTYDQKLDFPFQIEDTLSIYNLWLDVEHSVDYDFQNLYVQIQTRFPSGEELKESLSLELADKIGQWHGDCNSSSCQALIPIQEGAFFNQVGNYQITIEQYMRQNPIRGIYKVGFILEKTEQVR